MPYKYTNLIASWTVHEWLKITVFVLLVFLSGSECAQEKFENVKVETRIIR
jgi:hypothetical protein